MKKLVSIILLMSILFTTAYADYDYEVTVIDESRHNYLRIEEITGNTVKYYIQGPSWQTTSGRIYDHKSVVFDSDGWKFIEYVSLTAEEAGDNKIKDDNNSKGTLKIKQENYQYSLIDNETNECIIPYNDLKYRVNYCMNSPDYIVWGKNDDKTYVIDTFGTIIAEIPVRAYSVRCFDNGMYMASFDYTSHCYDFTGRVIFEDYFNSVKNGDTLYSVPVLYKLDNGIFVGIMEEQKLIALSPVIPDVAYNTNIRTYINGAEIPCYAVDGYPCVFAEDLGGYLFDVAWNGDEKRLDLTRNPEYVDINPVEVPAKGEHNTIFTDIYKNDVTVTVNGNAVKSYNTNGKMLIRAKDLENSGVTVTYENKKTIFDVLKENIEVYVNDTAVTFDQQPIIVEGRTLVPVRAIFEALGATVEWDEGSETVTSVKDGITVALKIGDNIMYVNGEGKELDVPAQLVNDRTLVPVRAISEAFGCTVDWNDITYSVFIK